MISTVEAKWGWIEGSHAMRTGLLDSLADADLAYTPGGTAMTLGALCKEMGEIEYAYIESLKTFKQDFEYKHADAKVGTDLSALRAWYDTLDGEMKSLLETLTEDDLKKSVDRSGYEMPVDLQLDVYLQALLIFFGKATIYLRTMGKPLPENIEQWIG